VAPVKPLSVEQSFDSLFRATGAEKEVERRMAELFAKLAQPVLTDVSVRFEGGRLAEPLPVVIAYRTVVVEGGKVRFFPDLYGRDAHLAAALRDQANRADRSGQSKTGI